MSITIRCGRAPAFQAFARARARASRSAPSSVGSAAIAAITRKAVASDATGPNSGSCSRTARRSARQSPPSASITARSRTTRPRSCPPRRSRILARPSDNAAVRPSLSAASANSPAPACDTSPSPSDATSTVKRRPSRDTLKVILPSRGFDLRHAEESLLNRTVRRPRPPGPQLLHARSGLGGGHLLGSRIVGRRVAGAVEVLAIELGEADAVGFVGDQQVQDGPDERQAAVFAGEAAHHLGAAFDLAQRSLQHGCCSYVKEKRL